MRDLPPGQRWRLLWRAVLGPVLSVAALSALYFGLPLDNSFTAATLLALGLCLCVVAGLVWSQYRAITRSPFPRVTAIGSMSLTISIFVLSFAAVYYLMAQSSPTSFSEPMTRLDSLYFTVTVLTTVGFGDIAARSQAARALTTVQMFGDLVLIGLAVRVFLNAVSFGTTERSRPDSAGQPADPKDVS